MRRSNAGCRETAPTLTVAGLVPGKKVVALLAWGFAVSSKTA